MSESVFSADNIDFCLMGGADFVPDELEDEEEEEEEDEEEADLVFKGWAVSFVEFLVSTFFFVVVAVAVASALSSSVLGSGGGFISSKM